MKRAIISSVFILMLAMIISCNQNNMTVNQGQDGVFIHVSHGPEDPHRVLMALQMAQIMSEDKDVLLYFDIKGVEAVLKDSPNISFSHFPDSKTQIQQLLDKGIPIMACPGCLKAAGKNPEDVISGIQIADKKGFFDFTSGRILTIDY